MLFMKGGTKRMNKREKALFDYFLQESGLTSDDILLYSTRENSVNGKITMTFETVDPCSIYNGQKIWEK